MTNLMFMTPEELPAGTWGTFRLIVMLPLQSEPNLRAPFETIYFAGLRKAGMPEE